MQCYLYFYHFSLQVYTVIAVICIVQLWAYSRYFKCTPLLGNIVVSIFCAGVPFTLLFIYDNEIFRDWVWAYSLFALLTTLIREIAKDIEDLDGDRSLNCKTLPVAYGFQKTRIIIVIISLLLCISVFLGYLFLPLSSARIFLYALLIILPSIGISFLIIRSESAISYPSIKSIFESIHGDWTSILNFNKWIT